MLRIPQSETHLACPKCRAPLSSSPEAFTCSSCEKRYELKNGKIYFEVYEGVDDESQPDTLFYRIKRYFKWNYPRVFFFIYTIVNVRLGPKISNLIEELPHGAIVLNVGAGAKLVDPRIINLDFVPEPGVDLVANAYELPFKDESVDMVVSESLLEHLEAPGMAVAEMKRVLKPGGTLFIVTPFLINVHSSPGDFYRWTIPGMEKLLEDFSMKKAGVQIGPTGTLTMTLREWFGMLLSFNNKILYQLWMMFFMIILIPLNAFDLIIGRYSFATQLASEYYFWAEKKK